MADYDINFAIQKNKVNVSSMLRIGVEAEIDAIKLYEKILSLLEEDSPAYKLFQHIIEEEMQHIGEFEELAERYDPNYKKNVEMGRKDVDEVIG